MKRKHIEVKHFSHPHDLHIIDIRLPNESPQKICHGCNIPLFGSCYNCSTCNFYLHQYCFDLPISIQSQVHPQHHLLLIDSPSVIYCNACDKSCNNFFVYYCSICDFNVHANCVGLDETRYKDDNERYILELLKQKMQENKFLRAKIDELKKDSHISQEDCQMAVDQTPNDVDLLKMEQDEYYHNKLLQFQMKSEALSAPKIGFNNFDQFF